MGKLLRALIIEDSEDDAQLLLRELRHIGYEVEFERVETAEAMQAVLPEKAWDLVLSDYTMPKFSALQALEVLKASHLDLPFIIISGTIGEETAVAALKAGANDFLVKGKFDRLGPAIEHELQEAQSRRARGQAERALQTSEELFGTAFQHSPVGICITTLDGKLQNVSQSLADMLGQATAELEGKHLNDITHPDDLEIGEVAVDRMMAGKIPSVSFEKRYLHKSGEPIWALVSSSLLRDASGQPVHFITHILNMTERKQAEEHARAQAIRLKVLADASQTFATTVHDYQAMLEIVARQTAEAMGGFCGVRLLSEDGEWLEMVATHDIDLEALEFSRRLSNQPMRADEPNFVQRILQSQQALLMPGVSEEQLRAVVKPEDWVHLKYIASHSRLLAPIRTRSQALGVLIIARKPGVQAFDEQDLSLAQDLADRAGLAISNARLFKQVQNELAERKQAEEVVQAKNEEIKKMSQQLWQAAKLATMGELAASIAHELNNPLATISLRTEMLQSQFAPADAQFKSLQIIESEVSRMSNLVTNLLQFSRRSSSQISTINVNEEVANTLELIQYHLRKNSILTVQELSPDISPIHADRQQLRQVFLNLFTNAADAMPLGGMLTIRTWSGEKPDAGITAPLRRSATQSLGLPASDLPQVFIEVSDTGEGIPPDKLERVWEAFYTTKPEGKGTGLGLAICRRIIQEHGGAIEVISDGIPGKGTTVRISLPTVKER